MNTSSRAIVPRAEAEALGAVHAGTTAADMTRLVFQEDVGMPARRAPSPASVPPVAQNVAAFRARLLSA